MNYEEATKILALIDIEFPDQKRNGEDAKMRTMLWASEFPEPYEEVLAAVRECLRHSQFPPKIANIVEWIVLNSEDPDDTPERAWEIYRKAFCQLGSYESAREAWEQLPESIQKITSPAEMKSFAFDMTSAEVNGFQKNKFIKAYDGLKAAERTRRASLGHRKKDLKTIENNKERPAIAEISVSASKAGGNETV